MKKADFIVIGVVAVVVAVMVFFLYGVNHDSGKYVQVEIDGTVTQTLDINENTSLTINTDNDGVNTLVIEDGYAIMTEANCPDGICTSHAKIRRTGESIICLPHKVVVTVVDDSGDDEIDAVA